jgi:16S rRNA processing protein RimM
VWFPHALTPADEVPTLSCLVGFNIIEVHSNRSVGRIAAIDDSTANLLFELEDGTLIPASDDLIEDLDTEGRKIVMNIPEGLLAL